MATILRLVTRSNHDTELVLQALLSKAAKGEFGDLAVCYRDQHGVEQWVFTGIYDVRPSEAMNAAACLMWRLAELAAAS